MRMILLEVVDLPTAGLATNLAEAQAEVLANKNWKWKRVVSSKHSRAHYLLPLLEWLARYEAENRPNALSHVPLCPGATSRGTRFVQFDYRALCETLGRRSNPPIMITDPVAACVRHLSKDGRDFPNDNKSRSDVFFQIFNRGKARFLTLDHEGQTCFVAMAISSPSGVCL
ncbi:hypothetical protein DFS34DRAFT_387966 [Phlyctochytrium arcticum]|nr:hypothetical protein DFS34DRAFT_387966 [Phlyctochytrium arcticum]